MLLTIDYIDTLLKTGNAPKEEKYEIKKEQLDKQFETILYGIEHNFTGDTEVEKLENAIKLKLTYLIITSIMREQEQSEVVCDKREITRTAREYEYLAQKKMNLRKQQSGYNEYNDLKCEKYASIEKINQNYLAELEWFNNDLEKEIIKGKINIDTAINMNSLFLSIKEAYRNLNNPDYKLNLDEKLSMKTNPNQENLYIPNNFSEITFLPKMQIKKQPDGTETVTAIILENFQDDKITIIKTGELGFGRFAKSDGKSTFKNPDALEEYKVLKYYKNPKLAEERKKKIENEEVKSEWDESENAEIFTVYTNLNRELLTKGYADSGYLKFHANTLFSTYNMEEAMLHNGGYIGEVSINRNNPKREYVISYNRDELCLAMEFNKHKKNMRLNNKSSININVKRQRHNNEEER